MSLNRGLGTKLLAAVLAVSLQAIMIPGAVASDSSAIAGTVLSTSPLRSLEGAVVHAWNTELSRMYTSSPTGDQGEFIVEDLPAGSYDLAVEYDGVLHTLGRTVRVTPGKTKDLRVRLDTSVAAQAVPIDGSHGFWGNPLTATLMVIGGIVLIGLLVDDNDHDEGAASPI